MTSNLYAPKIYLYSFRAGRWIAQFNTEEKLLEYFVRNYSAFFGPNNEVNLTWNDTKTCVDPLTKEQKTVLRDYVLVDENNKIVDPARYKDGVKALMKGLSEAELERMKAYERMGLLNIWRRWKRDVPVEHDNLNHGDILRNDETNYRFRCDPVPGTHHNRWHFCNYYRCPKTIGELRLMADPEDGSYLRPKRRYIPTAYDDIPRGRQRSWKAQGKKAKQWSKNKSRTSKGCGIFVIWQSIKQTPRHDTHRCGRIQRLGGFCWCYYMPFCNKSKEVILFAKLLASRLCIHHFDGMLYSPHIHYDKFLIHLALTDIT